MNHLQDEKSPYLKQHVFNPVDWYPWSEQAFSKAKKENKPIFLSIGYSTCHWCHVMAHESFEDTDVASLLNKNFVCIKVDREERPDIDKIYMKVCTQITGQSGWPLTIIMTPEKKPFFAATYLPKDSRYGIKGLLNLLPDITRMWERQHDQLVNSANQIALSVLTTSTASPGYDLTLKTLDSAYEQLFNTFDERYGGFGIRPKFPMPHHLMFLLRYWKRTGKNYCLNMVVTTLEQMRYGGLYDHIGFGFHRYSTDQQWIVPHFEKMLYDQALLLMTYTEAYQVTKKPLFKQTVQEMIEYIKRDMIYEDGGFFSAEDADSEGVEGKFYTWTYDELQHHLNEQDLGLIERIFSVNRDGNFTHEIGKKTKENIFYRTISIEEYSTLFKMGEKELIDKLEPIRNQLFRLREQRIHPTKDDKILTDWNGLMIAALAKAAQVFHSNDYLHIAEKAAGFIFKYMMKTNEELFHRYKDGEQLISGYADDYVFMIWGCLELFQSTFNLKYLELALTFTTYLLTHFWDEKNGGLFFTSDKGEKLLTRTKEVYDGAIPSANSVMMYNLIRLARITGKIEFEEKAKQIEQIFSNDIKNAPSGFTQLLIALDFAIGPSYEIVVVGEKEHKETKKMMKMINTNYLPNKVVILKDPEYHDTTIDNFFPYTKDFTQIDNQVTIYVCKNHLCQLPTTDINRTREMLN
jgi:uncharacterized protein YyaL (SSP411 family)